MTVSSNLGWITFYHRELHCMLWGVVVLWAWLAMENSGLYLFCCPVRRTRSSAEYAADSYEVCAACIDHSAHVWSRACVCVQVCLRRDGREHAIIRAEASCQPQNFTQLVLDTLRRRYNITGEWLWVISTHMMRNAYTTIVVLNSPDYPPLSTFLTKNIFNVSVSNSYIATKCIQY